MTLSKNKSNNSGNNLNNSHLNGNSSNANNNNNIVNSSFQECADCSSTNAQWASVNHGVLICDECCLAHRSLGRCISIIKSLRKSYWPQSLIDTLYELVRNNSNQIWESNMNNNEVSLSKQLTLRMKKPSSKETKLNFIRTKYENLAFISRGKYTSIEELNQQLLASVKTSNYEQTLRILSQGADANYKSHDDGYSCLHTAVLHNQIGQIELLCLYGADVTSLDRNSLTPHELAKANNYQQIADRLIELQFELTDEISYFLCNKRPDHRSGQHFYIPELQETFPNQDEMSRNTKFKLQEDHLFEELAKDIYDELDRRQIETIWKCTVPQNLVNEPIPFLVIKSCFTQTRNQLRQKLARFNSHEFVTLLVEILIESQRRFNLIEKGKTRSGLKNNLREETIEEDDPLYDKVPSDEDYASVASEPSSLKTNDVDKKPANTNKLPDKAHPISPLTINISNSPMQSGSLLSQKSNRSNKNTPSPSGARFTSKEHKVLTTNFDKPPSNLYPSSAAHTPQSQQSSASTLVANAESALNSIINSLNQIDYSSQSQQSPNVRSCDSKEQSSENIAQKINAVSLTAYNEIKNENELMQSMIERLMEENAQLRAEKMLLATANLNTSNTPHQNSSSNNNHNNYDNEVGLYSTVKNKKFNMFKENFAMCGKFKSGEDLLKQQQDEQLTLNSNHNNNMNHLKIAKFTEQNHYDNGLANNNNGTNLNSPIFHPNSSKQKNAKMNTTSSSETVFNEFYVPNSKNSKSNMNVDGGYEISIISYEGTFKINNDEHEVTNEVKSSPPKNSSKKTTKSESNGNVASSGSVNKLNESTSLLINNKPTNLSLKSGSNQQLQHLKLSPSKAAGSAHSFNKNSTKSNESESLNISSTSASNNNSHTSSMPTKDIVIRKMKKITKSVQELFKATKESEFRLFVELCEKVNHSVNEMIVLFPQTQISQIIQENLSILTENSKALIDLINKHQTQIELFANDASLSVNNVNNEELLKPMNSAVMSTASSSSSALSSGSASEVPNNNNNNQITQLQDTQMLKNMIVSNLVTYSYEIAYTVKRIVCIMGADN